jgi:hypothetical protein
MIRVALDLDLPDSTYRPLVTYAYDSGEELPVIIALACSRLASDLVAQTDLETEPLPATALPESVPARRPSPHVPASDHD